MNPEFECECCGNPLNENGHCINIDCTVAQDQAAEGAARSTRKASTPAANAPRAFTSSGRVD